MANFQDQFLSKITSDLKDKYSCHSFILYGSRARGEANEKSDWDLLAVRDEGEQFRDARIFEGQYLDIWVYSRKDIVIVDEGLLRLRRGVVLEEKDQIASKLLAQVEALFQKGPNPLPLWERELRATWTLKMLDRAKAQDAEGNFRLHWFLTDSLMNYFQLMNMWYLGPKESLAWLKSNDPETFKIFDLAFSPKASMQDISSLGTLLVKAASSNL